MRTGSHPVLDGLAEKPWPGSEGITRWNASALLAPCAVGLVSGSMIFSCSMIEPGQPWVTISGVLVLGRDVEEVDVQPVDLVMKCGRAFSFASHLRQSYSVAQ